MECCKIKVRSQTGMSEMIHSRYCDELDTCPALRQRSGRRSPSYSSALMASMFATSRSIFPVCTIQRSFDQLLFSCHHLLSRLYWAGIPIRLQILLSNHPHSPMLASETARATKNTDAGISNAKGRSGFSAGVELVEFHRNNSNSFSVNHPPSSSLMG